MCIYNKILINLLYDLNSLLTRNLIRQYIFRKKIHMNKTFYYENIGQKGLFRHIKLDPDQINNYMLS